MIRSDLWRHDVSLPRWAAGSGLLMTLLALLWMHRAAAQPVWFRILGPDPARGAVIGLVSGALFALVAWWGFSRLPAGRAILHQLDTLVGFDRLRLREILLIALSAGVGEEMFFRGMVQPLLGLPLTALLFGVLHFLNGWYVAYATAAGFLLGWLAETTDGLVAPIVCHALADGLLLWEAKHWAARRTPGR